MKREKRDKILNVRVRASVFKALKDQSEALDITLSKHIHTLLELHIKSAETASKKKN